MFRNKLFTFINLSGLAVGVACVSVIVVYIANELSYDRFHKSAEDIYRIAWFGDGDSPQTRTPHPMAMAMVNDFPEVESAVSMTPIWGPGLTKQTFTFNNPETNDWFQEREILMVDTSFFNVFSFELLEGNKERVLKRPDIILITESIAVKYFGIDWAKKGVTGKMLAVNSPQEVIEIGGVIENPPLNSHFHFDFLISYERVKAVEPNNPFLQWGDFGHFNYLKLKKGTDAEALERKVFAWAAPHIDADKESIAYFEEHPNAGFQLQPLTAIHLHSNIRWELEPNGNSAYVYIMSAAAFFILIIAAFNFMNLTTAQSVKRSREIGVRKSLGARKTQLRLQFIAETTLLALLAVVIGGFLAEISLPFFENITGLQLNNALLYSPTFLLGFILLVLILGITAGIYPAFFLSKIPTTRVLKGEFFSGKKGSTFREVLVIVQFSMAMLLITGSLVILNQLQFLQNKPLGFNQAQKIVIPMLEGEMQRQYPVLEERLLKLKSVQHVAAASNIPGGQFNQNPVYAVNNPTVRMSASEVMSSHDYLNLFGVKLKAGRYFSPAILTDTASAYIINEALANALNLKDPIGKELILDSDDELLRGTVIGVTEDFHYQSLHTPVRPMIVLQRRGYNHLIVDVMGDDFESDLAQIQTIWQQYADNFQFSYKFLDSSLAAQYQAEKVTGKVFSFFSLVAVFIACLGLFSMASISMQRKQKEMGVRKVLGASAGQVLLMLLTNFSKPIVLALLLAAPLAWWIMDTWLQNFTYHIGLGLPVFLIAGTLVLIIAWGTIAWLVFKTATANPVESLKIE